MNLPPYSGLSPKCPKCHHHGALVKWHEGIPLPAWDRVAAHLDKVDQRAIGRVLIPDEHIVRTCNICGYRWPEAPLDVE